MKTLITLLLVALICAVLFDQAASYKTTKATKTNHSVKAGNSTSISKKGCGSSLPSGMTAGGKSKTFTLGGRTYLLYVPKSYDKSTPTGIVFAFHGAGGTSENQESNTGLSKSSINSKYIAIYPQGDNKHWEGAPYATKGVDDVAFVRQIIENVSTKFCVDRERIYASGHSNGGGFTAFLACSPMSAEIAAFTANSAAMYQGASSKNCKPAEVAIKCNPGRAQYPFMEIHGTADQQIPYHGGVQHSECLPSVPVYMQKAAARMKLDAKNSTTPTSYGAIYKWGGGLLTHVMVEGMGHTWTGGFKGFVASKAALDFFEKWTLKSKL